MDGRGQIHARGAEALSPNAPPIRTPKLGFNRRTPHTTLARITRASKRNVACRGYRGYRWRRRGLIISASSSDMRSKTETFVETLAEDAAQSGEGAVDQLPQLRSTLLQLQQQVGLCPLLIPSAIPFVGSSDDPYQGVV